MQEQEYKINCDHWNILETILNAVKEISVALQHTPVIKLESFNKFGDEQLHQDVHCDELV